MRCMEVIIMHKSKKFKKSIRKMIWTVRRLVPIPSELQCPNECPNCKSCTKTCPFKPSLAQNTKFWFSYKRFTHDPFMGNKEITVFAYKYFSPEGRWIECSTIDSFFPHMGQYPTYFILLCVSLMVDEGLTADEVLFVLSQYIEENGIKGAKLPNRSTLYRWKKKYMIFKETGAKSNTKKEIVRAFAPLDFLMKTCKAATKTASKVTGEVYQILHRYILALEDFIHFSKLVIDIDHLMNGFLAD